MNFFYVSTFIYVGDIISSSYSVLRGKTELRSDGYLKRDVSSKSRGI